MSVVEYLVFGAVILTLLVGIAAVASLAISHFHEILKLRRGVATEVWCPRHQQSTVVRVGVPEGDMRLHVLWCECQPDGSPRCDAACFPMLNTLQPRRAVSTPKA